MVKVIYGLTDKFPKSEVYGLTSQMRRAAVSVPSNIAEGYKRKGLGEYINFLSIADASAAELETQLIIAKDLYVKIDFSKAEALLEEIQKMMVSMVGKLNAKRSTLNAGFTLVETLAVVLLFSVITVLMGSIFVGSLDLQRRAFNLQQAEENANFVLESMAKEIRVSQIQGPESCVASSPSSVSTLSIIHPINGAITYSLSGNNMHRNANGIDTVINSNTVQFTYLYFCVWGTPIDDRQQPRVVMATGLRSVKTKQQAVIDFQTTISQRFLSN